MTTDLRHRIVPASEPTAEPHCRLTREDGQRRQADTSSLFASLAEQRETGEGNEFVFTGDRDSLWHQVSIFVDEEVVCCPFFTFEQIETAEGVVLRIEREGAASR